MRFDSLPRKNVYFLCHIYTGVESVKPTGNGDSVLENMSPAPDKVLQGSVELIYTFS
jgi:hypothetical protein